MNQKTIWVSGIALVIGTLAVFNWLQEDGVVVSNDEHSHPHITTVNHSHKHTHNGQLDHGHSHASIPDGTTHSHPHEHPHQHGRDEEMEKNGWYQFGHVHDADESTFYARCIRTGNEFRLELLIATKTAENRQFLNAKKKLAAEVYVGNKRTGSLLFESHEYGMLAIDDESTFHHPILSLAISQVPVRENRYDIFLPVQNGMKASFPSNLVPTAVTSN